MIFTERANRTMNLLLTIFILIMIGLAIMFPFASRVLKHDTQINTNTGALGVICANLHEEDVLWRHLVAVEKKYRFQPSDPYWVGRAQAMTDYVDASALREHDCEALITRGEGS